VVRNFISLDHIVVLRRVKRASDLDKPAVPREILTCIKIVVGTGGKCRSAEQPKSSKTKVLPHHKTPSLNGHPIYTDRNLSLRVSVEGIFAPPVSLLCFGPIGIMECLKPHRLMSAS